MYISLWALGLLLLVSVVWSSWPDAEWRAFHREMRQWRREAGRREMRQWRATHPIVSHSDVIAIPLLLGIAVAVIALCR